MLIPEFNNNFSFGPLDMDDFMYNFLFLIPFSAHIKETNTGKYLSMNKISALQFGFISPQKVIGLTVSDLNSIMEGHWDSKFSEEIASLDQKAKFTKKPVLHKHMFLSYSGYVRIEKMIKMPLITKNKKIHAILTFGEDLTKKSNLFDLFSYYKKFYTDKKSAINRFLQFLTIDKYFYVMPTEAELRMLITMRQKDSHKAIAGYLGITVKTVEIHRKHLKDKLKISLDNILCLLRDI